MKLVEPYKTYQEKNFRCHIIWALQMHCFLFDSCAHYYFCLFVWVLWIMELHHLKVEDFDFLCKKIGVKSTLHLFVPVKDWDYVTKWAVGVNCYEERLDEIWCCWSRRLDDGVYVDNGVNVDDGAGVDHGDENVWKYKDRLEKEFKECCIQNVLERNSKCLERNLAHEL